MKHPNLLLSNTCRTERYTPQSRPIPKKTKNRKRSEHAATLTSQLDEALRDDTAKRSDATVERKGLYLEFISSNDYKLKLESLEDMKRGIRLLNVREAGSTQRATVYVPEGKERILVDKVANYGDPDKDTKTGKPSNNELFANLEEIKLARLSSFWTGSPTNMPSDKPKWVELWLFTKYGEGNQSYEILSDYLKARDIPHSNRYDAFPERIVILAKANASKLNTIIDGPITVAEIRESLVPNSSFVRLNPGDQKEWLEELLSRTSFSVGASVICLLDTGINRAHPLLAPITPKESVTTCNDVWGSADTKKHGTLIAGIAVYGDLQSKLDSDSPIVISHRLESVKIFHLNEEFEEPDLYGRILKDGINIAAARKHETNRIYVTAITANADEMADGLASSWSAALDEAIACADDPDEQPELVLVSAGNVDANIQQTGEYPEINVISSVRSPGQAWNALTVGAYTSLTAIKDTSILSDSYKIIAPKEGLSPYSTTSASWAAGTPIKPELVCEGGNMLEDQGLVSSHADLSILTTGPDIIDRPLDTFDGTSAAVAEAAWMAAELENEYPSLWPETIRGLMIHSARWSKSMIKEFIPTVADDTKRKGRRNLLRSCGYGIPNLTKARECQQNSVNMIIQGTLQPFTLKTSPDGKKSEAMKEMHFHTLPWPESALLELGNDISATLRVTLSYYIEPGPGQIGQKNRYRYASHGLRFDVNKPGETFEEFEQRINASMRDKNADTSTGDSDGWYLGPGNRNVGSIHSDFKKTTALNLSDVKYVAVYPVIGWWRTRKQLGKIESKTRYSLIVTIETAETEADLYAEIVNKISTPVVIPTQF